MPLRLTLPKFRAARPQDQEAAPAADPSLVADAEVVEDPKSQRRKRLVRLATVICIALAAGQYVQSTNRGAARAAAVALAQQGPRVVAPAQPSNAVLTLVVQARATAASANPGLGIGAEPALVHVSLRPETPPALPAAPPVLAQAAPDCAGTLDLTARPGAMIGLSLTAPCNAGQRAVIAHAGLTITARTDAAGALALDLPALAADGVVTVSFADGLTLQDARPVPDLSGLRRLALQWQAGDRFTLQAAPDAQGIALGDPAAQPGLLAQIHTLPAGSAAAVMIEAAVTPDTCGREMLAQTLDSRGGQVILTDLTLAMPDCDGRSGYLVLNNLFGDMKIAAVK